MPDLEENHEKLAESGPDGSVRAHIQPGWIVPGLGSLWDTSRTPKPPKNQIKNSVFRVFAYFPIFSPIPLSSLTAAGQPCRAAYAGLI